MCKKAGINLVNYFKAKGIENQKKSMKSLLQCNLVILKLEEKGAI